MSLSRYDDYVRRNGALIRRSAPVVAQSYDWSDDNLPWAYAAASEWESRIPAGTTVVDLEAGSDFYTTLTSTLNHAGGRVIVKLAAGVYHLDQFRMIGNSGSPMYSMGFWHPNLQGLIGAGPDKTFVQMDENSLSQAQLDGMATMKSGPSGATLLIAMFRIDAASGTPLYLGGLTFRAADQQMLTAADPSTGIVVPQPAPHLGLQLYDSQYGGTLSHVRFQAAGRACTSMPPFETSNCLSQYGYVEYFNCEFDGRTSADLDPAQPRRCAPWMGNNETLAAHTDCWMHHSNLSRYAVNDMNQDTQGAYTLTRTKIDHIADDQNRDPAINGGDSLGGLDPTDCMGFESCSATITITDCVLEQNNPIASVTHARFTTVGRDPRGGKLFVSGGVFRSPQTPQLDGYLTFWVPDGSWWYRDGPAETFTITGTGGQALQPYTPSQWPPTTAQLAARPSTAFYLVRN